MLSIRYLGPGMFSKCNLAVLALFLGLSVPCHAQQLIEFIPGISERKRSFQFEWTKAYDCCSNHSTELGQFPSIWT